MLAIGSARLRCEQAGDALLPERRAGARRRDAAARSRRRAGARRAGIGGCDRGAGVPRHAHRGAPARAPQRLGDRRCRGGLAVFAGDRLVSRDGDGGEITTEPAPRTSSVDGGLGLTLAGTGCCAPASTRSSRRRRATSALRSPIEVTRAGSQRFELRAREAAGSPQREHGGAGRGSLRRRRARGRRAALQAGAEAGSARRRGQGAALPAAGTVDHDRGRRRGAVARGRARARLGRSEGRRRARPGRSCASTASSPGRRRSRRSWIAASATLELKLAGYKVWRQPLAVEAGVPQQLPVIALVKSDGLIDVRSSPGGAAVTVDGRFRGETPLELELAPGRSYRVTLSKAGYAPVSRTIEPVSGEDTSLSVTLQGQFGMVRVASEPPDAEIYVDGALRGKAPQSLELTAVPHRIEARKSGYASQTSTVTPRPGFEQQVLIALQTAQARAARVARARVRRRSCGQPLVLVASPGQFQMGASRREPGRRANETLYEVSLQRAFYIGAKEVTNAEFRRYDSAHQSGSRDSFSLDGDAQPVVRLSWVDAARYCNWLSEQEGLPPAYTEIGGKLFAASPMTTGYRLPTEAEWTWVARYAGE